MVNPQSEYLEKAALIIGIEGVLLSTSHGQASYAAAVPITGYVLKKIGEIGRLTTCSRLGKGILLGTLAALPGAVAGYGTYLLAGKTFFGKMLALGLSSGITYKIVTKALFLQREAEAARNR